MIDATKHPALDSHSRFGGSTFTHDGQDLSSKHTWAIGVLPEASHISERPPSEEEYGAFHDQHADLLSRHSNSAIGTYHDPSTGLHHMEVVATSPNRAHALKTASDFGENHIFNVNTGEKVQTGAERGLIPHSPDARFAQSREGTPPKSLYSGTHFSDAKADKIEGARRGQSSVGDEGARLRSGPGAPPGFYSYASGTLPEPALAQRKFAHSVRGQFALATTDHPAFQSAQADVLSKGGDPGHAINAGEHALRDAGYDGYTNPRHPGITFHFGDHELTQDAAKSTQNAKDGLKSNPDTPVQAKASDSNKVEQKDTKSSNKVEQGQNAETRVASAAPAPDLFSDPRYVRLEQFRSKWEAAQPNGDPARMNT